MDNSIITVLTTAIIIIIIIIIVSMVDINWLCFISLASSCPATHSEHSRVRIKVSAV